MESDVQKKPGKSGKINVVLISLIVFILIATAVSIKIASSLINYEKVYNGVSINGLNVGGATRGELEQLLKTHFDDNVKDLSIVLKTDSKELKTTYSGLEVTYDNNSAEKNAFAVGRTGNLFNRLYEIFLTNKNGRKIDMALKYDKATIRSFVDKFYAMTLIEVKQSDLVIEGDKVTIHSGRHGENIDKNVVMSQLEEAIKTLSDVSLKADIINIPSVKINTDELLKKIDQKAADAGFSVEDGKLVIIPHIVGRTVDKDALSSAVTELDKQEDSSKVIPVETVQPAITTEIANSMVFKDTLATMRSHFSTGNENDKNRASNMALALTKINGWILAPGDTFSFNNIVGPRTEEGGYQAAHTYIAGKVVDGIGGGICQISSTLYNAVLKSDLQVLSRRNHMFTVGYVPKGQDATVSYGSTDFKFKNNTKWPIKVVATITKDNYVYFSMKGTNVTPGKEVVITSQVIKTVPYKTAYINDPTLAEGKTSVKQTGKDGYVVDTFKTIKQDGLVVSTSKLHTSTYSPLQKEVLVGTKKADSTSQPSVASSSPVTVQQGVDDAENPPAQ